MEGTRRDLAEARKAAGFSQERLAETVGVERTTVRRWERGQTTPQPWVRPKLAAALGLSDERLAELLREPVSRPWGREHEWSDDTALLMFPALEVDEHRHLAAALSQSARRVDGEVVGYFRRQLESCAGHDGAHGAAATLPTVLGVLSAIDEHAHDVRPSVRCELLSVGALGAEFAGWLYRDVRDSPRAAFWYTRATEWAQEASDHAMQGYVLLKKSQMAYDERDGVRVLTLAQAAQYGPWRLPPHVRVEVTQQEARGLAMLGESMSLVEQKLDAARELLADVSSGDEASAQLGGAYDETTLSLRDASCYIEAGQPRRAAELYAEVLATASLSVRDRGYFTARLTSALALAGEPDAAAEHGLEALARATATTSQRTRRELERALLTLTPWRQRPGPRALREAVTAAPGSSG